jgi:hypothetical protein
MSHYTARLLVCSLWIAGCTSEARPGAHEYIWQHEFDASALTDRQAFQLAVDHVTGAVAVVAGDELSYLDATGKSLWETDFRPYRQIWMGADGAVEAVDQRISNTGKLLDKYSTGLGYRAGTDSQGNAIALSDGLVKLDADRNELFRRQLTVELGTPRAQIPQRQAPQRSPHRVALAFRARRLRRMMRLPLRWDCPTVIRTQVSERLTTTHCVRGDLHGSALS